MAKKGMFKGRLMCLAVAVVFGGCGGKNLAREEKNGYTERIEETVDAPIEERDTFMKAGNPMEGSEWGTPIYDIEDLESIGNTGNYILMEDIDCAGMEHGINDFEGEFEGNYHQLRNLGQALFSDSFSGTVRNLAIIDTVSDTAGRIEELHQGTVDNCYVTGVIGKSNEEETARAGLVQYMLGTDGCIRDSFNKADIYTTAGEKVPIPKRKKRDRFHAAIVKITG